VHGDGRAHRGIDFEAAKSPPDHAAAEGPKEPRKAALSADFIQTYASLKLVAVTELAPRIVVDPAVRLGRPVIQGTRVPVDVVVGQLAAGLSAGDVAEEYGITREDVFAALAYAAKILASDQVRAVV
jgi:uncharacterized protein (DUF433 family)